MRCLCRPGGPFNANTYLISSEQRSLVIIDPTDASYIRSVVEQGGYKPIAVLLTHGHYDHFCALNDLLDCYDVPAYVHFADVEMLNDPHKNCMDLIYNEPPEVCFCHAVTPIQDGDALVLEGFVNPIKVIHSPGHSKGCVCYLFNEREPTLFTGDVLFAGMIGRCDLYGSSTADMQKSLAYLATLPDEIVVCPGHGPSSDIGREKKCNPYLRF